MKYLYLILTTLSVSLFLLPFAYNLGLINIFDQSFLIKSKNYLPNLIFFTFAFSFTLLLLLLKRDKFVQSILSRSLEKKLLMFDLNQINKIKDSTYLVTLSIVFSIFFMLFFEKTVFEWSTISEIPVIIRLQDPNYLINDFFTNSIIESPKIIFAYFINFFNFFGINWLVTLYILKVASVIVVPTLLFKVYKNISNLWISNKLKTKYQGLIRQSIFIMSFGLIGLLQFFPQMFPFGWGAMELTHSIDPMKAAFSIGLVYLGIHSSKKNYPFLLSIVLLFICSILHPVIGISIFLISFIFIFLAEINTIKIKEYIYLALFAITLPSILMTVLFDNSSFLSSSEFLDIYIKQRHPHHYLTSEILNIFSLLWIILLVLPMLLSKKIGNNKLFILSSFVFASIIIAVTLQFVLSEIYPIKIIMKIGPTRFTSFCSIMLSMVLIILLPSLLDHKNYRAYRESIFYKITALISAYISSKIYKLQKMLSSRLSKILSIPLLIFFVFTVTFDNKIEASMSNSEIVITDWLKKNTAETDIIFSPDFDTFLIRIRAERSVYADFSFPFSEKHMKEFSDRYQFYLNSKGLKLSDYECLNGLKKQIDFIILGNQNKGEISPIFTHKNWSIYDAAEIYCSN